MKIYTVESAHWQLEDHMQVISKEDHDSAVTELKEEIVKIAADNNFILAANIDLKSKIDVLNHGIEFLESENNRLKMALEKAENVIKALDEWNTAWASQETPEVEVLRQTSRMKMLRLLNEYLNPQAKDVG